MKLRKQRKKPFQAEEIDITSLLDILVILLVFLLRSFNTSELNVDLINNLALPYSYSVITPQYGIIVQTDKDKNVYINNTKLNNLDDSDFETVFSAKLSQLKIEEEKARPFTDKQIINLVFDKGLDYQSIDHILRSVDQVGFKKYKLLTQGKE